MIKLFGVEGFDEAHFIRHALKIWQKVRNFRPRLTTFLERKTLILWRTQKIGLLANESQLIKIKELIRAKLTRSLLQLRLKVKQIEMRRSSDHMNVNHPLRLRRMMQSELH